MENEKFRKLLKEAIQNAYDDGQLQQKLGVNDYQYYERCENLGHYKELFTVTTDENEDICIECGKPYTSHAEDCLNATPNKRT